MTQDLFHETVPSPEGEPDLLEMENQEDGKLRSSKLTVSHHRVRNLGELLSHRKLVFYGTPILVLLEQ